MEKNRTKCRTSAENERKQEKETIEPIEIEKLQENNKWVIMEDERRWTYVIVAMGGKASRHLEGGSSKISEECRHLRASHNSQNKTRKKRRELVSQTLSHQFGYSFFTSKFNLCLQKQGSSLYSNRGSVIQKAKGK